MQGFYFQYVYRIYRKCLQCVKEFSNFFILGMDIVRIVLERAKTAKEAVEVGGSNRLYMLFHTYTSNRIINLLFMNFRYAEAYCHNMDKEVHVPMILHPIGHMRMDLCLLIIRRRGLWKRAVIDGQLSV